MNPQLQISRFSNGGFVIHKITTAPCTGRCSAWYDSAGRMVEAEQFTRDDRARPVKRLGPVWMHLASLGPRHK